MRISFFVVYYRKCGASAPEEIAMPKTAFPKPGNMLYPVPPVLVGCADDAGRPNLITVAWTGTVCSDPPMLSISVRKERYSYDLIRRSGVFTVNLVSRDLVGACDFCGVRSGRDTDKFAECGLTAEPGVRVNAPTVAEAPVSIECEIRQILDLGSHVMFVAEAVCVLADDRYFDETGRFRLEDADPVAYAHGTYYALGDALGTFGFSVRKKPSRRSRAARAKR